MTELEAIAQSDAPRTRSTLAADLTALGVQPGDVLLVHASLSRLGWVAGGPVAVIQALQDAVTPEGTLVMPTFTLYLTDPSGWRSLAVPQEWWDTVRAEMSAFDPALTPTRHMGRIAELFRTWPDVRRSLHPHSSFAAWGKHAEFVTGNHSLEYSLGNGSPLARVYELNGRVLLLGTEVNSSLHLAEVRAGRQPVVPFSGPMLNDGERQWMTFDEIDYNEDSFPPVKAAFEATGAVTRGQVGSTTAKLMFQREVVDFASRWWTDGAARDPSEVEIVSAITPS
jgi:aminoglycoside 3-N-acetyltransferase